ncbi:MAG: GIY-YIG nuclease family protein [Bacteroidales bacterium]|nr:GIY-YIG nuclease family protein [Bacteroidales bacterium]
MKIIDIIIYSLPIEFVDKVYLVGEITDYYKLYLEQKDNCIVKIDLKSTIENNFIRFKVVESVYMGNLTQELSTNKALKLLGTCNWENRLKPDSKTLKITKELLKIKNFKPLKKEIDNNLPFFFWIRKQEERDDLIGDLAYDISRDDEVGFFKTYKELESHISFKQTGHWGINSFKDSKKDSGRVSPLLCLKLAKMEFDISNKKEQLKNFRIANTNGYIYFLNPENEKGPIKIGRARNIKQRINQLQTSLPYDLKLIGYIETSNYIELENDIHEKYKNKNLKREWFDLNLDEVKCIIDKYNGEIIK